MSPVPRICQVVSSQLKVESSRPRSYRPPQPRREQIGSQRTGALSCDIITGMRRVVAKGHGPHSCASQAVRVVGMALPLAAWSPLWREWGFDIVRELCGHRMDGITRCRRQRLLGEGDTLSGLTTCCRMPPLDTTGQYTLFGCSTPQPIPIPPTNEKCIGDRAH